MAMDAGEIERLIKVRIPDAQVTIRDLAGDALTLGGDRPILVAKLRESFEGWLPAYMAGGVS